YVIVFEVDGRRAGLQVSGPDCGALFLYWTFVLEDYRRSGIAVYAMRHYIEHFDDGNWHKLTTLTRTNNRAAIVIMQRFGWVEIARLDNHIFGEDFLQFEFPLQKTRPGYRLLRTGRRARLVRRVRRVLQLG
ncbi:MAG: GNAT family N-acetyltransferase, partial [Cucumibacter sp.]